MLTYMVVPFCTLVAITADGTFEEKCVTKRIPYIAGHEVKDPQKDCALNGGVLQLQKMNDGLYELEKEWTKALILKWREAKTKSSPQGRTVLAPEGKIHRFKPGRCVSGFEKTTSRRL